MNRMSMFCVSGVSVVLATLALFGEGTDPGGLSAPELVRLHLASIAAPNRLAARKAFAVQGDCEYRLLSGGVLSASGTGQLVSEGEAYSILFDFAAGEYAGTQFVTDGKRAEVEYTSGGQTNPLRTFLQGQGALLTDGLLGGVLTTAWALLDVDERKPDLKYEGIVEVDGRRLHRLAYRIRRGGWDLRTRLYFEPETYHHVLSTYEVKVPAPMGASPEASSRQRVGIQRLKESFSEFENLDGYMLPTVWTVEYFKSANDASAYSSNGFANLNLAPGVAGSNYPAGAALTGNVPTGTFLLQWQTTIRRSARNGEIPPPMLKKLLNLD